MDHGKLMALALEARDNAYAPYSGFAVGAALLCKNGRLFKGANVENAAFSPSLCAERVVLGNAVSAGVREFRAIAVAGGPKDQPPTQACMPCGVCLQTLLEFCDLETFEVAVGLSPEDYRVYKLKALIPHGFSMPPEGKK